MTALNEDDRRYIRSRLLRLEAGSMLDAIEREATAIEDQKSIIAEATYWSQVLSGKIAMTQEQLRGRE
jgi:hypothetical protein